MFRILLLNLFLPALIATPFERDGKIIGGEAARRGQFPYQVSLQYKSGSQFCGGSILTTMCILTAAHCEMKKPSDFRAVAGSLSYINFALEDGQVRGLVKFIQHENYKNVGTGYDVAIAKVDEPFTFTAFIQPIQLEKVNDKGAVIASGWGLTKDGDNNSIPEFLHTVILAIVSTHDCSSAWNGIPKDVVCASLPGKDTCQGDSGGPLAQNLNEKLVQVGITSFGAECASKTLPGVYTEVSKYSNWIQKTCKQI